MRFDSAGYPFIVGALAAGGFGGDVREIGGGQRIAFAKHGEQGVYPKKLLRTRSIWTAAM